MAVSILFGYVTDHRPTPSPAICRAEKSLHLAITAEFFSFFAYSITTISVLVC